MVVAGILLVVAIGTALSPLLAWRDFGSGLKPDESGWRMVDGSLGRGWVVLIMAVLVAVAGGLLVAGRKQAGMRLARVTSVAMVVFAGAEWAFGMNQVESGPGIGLWILLAIGSLLILFLGAVAGESGEVDEAVA
jgi:hypothetical protein